MIQKAGRIAAHRKPPGNLTAYELYLLGTEKLERMNRVDVEEAIRLLKGVVSSFKLAAEAAERVVMLDPSDAEAHALLGFSFGDRNDLVRAKAEFDTALRMAPNGDRSETVPCNGDASDAPHAG